MVSERLFVKISDLNPFLYPKIAKKSAVIEKFLVSAAEIAASGKLLFEGITYNVSTIESFLRIVDAGNRLFSSIVTLSSIWLINHSKTTSEDISELDALLGLDQNPISNWSLFYLFNLFLSAIHIIAELFNVGLKRYLYAFDVIINTSFVFQTCAIVFMIAERFGNIKDIFVDQKDFEGVMKQTRALFHYYRSFENTVRFRITSSIFRGLTILLLSLSSYWKVYGLHAVNDSFEYNHAFSTIFAHGYIVFELVCLGIASNRTSDNVEDVMMELDREITIDEKSFEYRSQLHILMLELSHNQTDFSLLGLVSVDNAALTAACGFVISCMMVFIQFMKI